MSYRTVGAPTCLWPAARASPQEDGQAPQERQDVEPVEIEGRKIATTFWGEAWCDHLESFSDFANRLPRGRTYVRNGSVCHLEIAPARSRPSSAARISTT